MQVSSSLIEHGWVISLDFARTRAYHLHPPGSADHLVYFMTTTFLDLFR